MDYARSARMLLHSKMGSAKINFVRYLVRITSALDANKAICLTRLGNVWDKSEIKTANNFQMDSVKNAHSFTILTKIGNASKCPRSAKSMILTMENAHLAMQAMKSRKVHAFKVQKRRKFVWKMEPMGAKNVYQDILFFKDSASIT